MKEFYMKEFVKTLKVIAVTILICVPFLFSSIDYESHRIHEEITEKMDDAKFLYRLGYVSFDEMSLLKEAKKSNTQRIHHPFGRHLRR